MVGTSLAECGMRISECGIAGRAPLEQIAETLCQQQAHRAAGRLERRRVNPWSSASGKRIDGVSPQATAGWLDNSANCSSTTTLLPIILSRSRSGGEESAPLGSVR